MMRFELRQVPAHTRAHKDLQANRPNPVAGRDITMPMSATAGRVGS